MIILVIRNPKGETVRVNWEGQFICPRIGEWLGTVGTNARYFGKVVHVSHALDIKSMVQEINIDLG